MSVRQDRRRHQAGPSEVWPIGVRALVDFVCREGDLGAMYGSPVTPGDGLRCQQRWQASRGPDYRTEVSIRADWQDPRGTLRLAGRLDGLWHDGNCWWVDEVKTHRGEGGQASPAGRQLALAQARIYAALWARQEQLETVGVRLVFIDADNEAVTTECLHCSSASLAEFLAETCAGLLDWLAPLTRARRARDRALAALAFPRPPMRSTQGELAAATTGALRTGEMAVLEAPTGAGKTLGVLYGALQALPAEGLSRLLYLTARRSGRQAVWQELPGLTRDAPLRVLDLQARQVLCQRPDTPCRPECCPFARDYYSHRRAALTELLGLDRPEVASLIDATRSEQTGRKFGICPVRLQRDAARWCDLVVMDLNQLFDPLARQRGLLDPQEGHSGLLVDEAHNLDERLRQMFSAKLDVAELERQQTLAWGHSLPWAALLGRLITLLQAPDRSAAARVAGAEAISQQLAKLLLAWQQQAPAGVLHGSVRNLDVMLGRFLYACMAARQMPDDFQLLAKPDVEADFRLSCLAPGALWQQLLPAATGTVLFSATLPPDEHLRATLRLPAGIESLRLTPPFDLARQCTLVVADLDLAAHRRLDNLDRLVGIVRTVVAARRGHYLLFVPSFSYLQRLAEALQPALPDVELLVQRPGLSLVEAQGLLEQLRHPDGQSRLLLAVAGGQFGEAVDLPGDALIGVIVAGIPVPVPDPERLALQARHDPEGRQAAFHVPAMQRVRQAAGRLLRRPEDAGVLCLVDRRFRLPHYARGLPADWAAQTVGSSQLAQRVAAFWQRLEAMRDRAPEPVPSSGPDAP